MGDFQQLQVWQKSKDLAVLIYKITNTDSFRKDYGLKDQIQRASVSVPSNIAEGDERNSNKEAIRFFYIAKGSLAEVLTQLIIANEVGYIEDGECDEIMQKIREISKMLAKLISYRKAEI